MAGSLSRLVAAFVLAAAVLAGAGLGAEIWRFGPSNASASEKVERDVRRRFDSRARDVGTLARRVATEAAAAIQAAVGRSDDLPVLFERLASLAPAASGPVTPSTVTVYVPQPEGQYKILAWSDGPAEHIGADRLSGSEALFVAPGTLGLRLVQLQPVVVDGRRVAVAAAETVLAPSAGVGQPSGTFRLDTTFGPVTLRFPGTGEGGHASGGFMIPIQGGVIDVDIAPADLRAVRLAFRHLALTVAALPIAIAALLLTAPLVRRRHGAKSFTRFVGWSLLAAALVAAAAAGLVALSRWVEAPPDVAFAIQASAALAVAILVPISAWWRPSRRWRPARAPARFALEQLLAGAILALCVWLTTGLLRDRITPVALAQWQFPLFPLQAEPLIFLTGLLLAEIAIYWTFTGVLAFMAARWRLRGRDGWTWLAVFLWFFPAVLLLAARPAGRTLLLASWTLGLAASGGFAISAAAFRRRYRETTQAMRLLLLYGALLVPVLMLYPVAGFFADSTARDIVARSYAPSTARLPNDTYDVLTRVLHEIDRIPLPRLVSLVSAGASDGRPVPHFPAFDVWSQTSLATTRLTGAIELYAPDGTLVSRFALNVPEYQGSGDAAARLPASSCTWGVYGEAVPFGAEERDMLHARRRLCDEGGHPLGAVVVHVINDYQALPFISTPTPYHPVIRSTDAASRGFDLAGLQVVVYGWSFTPLFTSGHVAWPITPDLFSRLYRSRQPFWTRLEAEGRSYEVHFSNDSRFIYALGYPSSTWFQHLSRLAEGAALVASVFLVWLVGAGLYAPLARPRAAPLRALLDEIRTSFYRRLFLLFVLAAVGPVLIFATAFGVYMNAKLRTDVETEASTVVTVARRVLEQAASGAVPGPFDDDMLVWVGQVVHQDVNLFEGPELLATSQRDLYASGLLPARTPAAAYRAIALNRLPTFVGEEWLGPFGYVVAAAPMPAAGRDFVLSVPLASRQRDIGREVDELYRGVLVGAVVVVLFAAALGASAASRVSDPVARLSQATRQIAAGTLDVRLVAETADELSRLIEDFNSMTARLSAQRAELAHANQLKAWAEMARQVAHEIKNPLTPIQLAAEHLAHVHADRGRPLGPVFDQCVDTVLRQVRLLRRIAGEFANFAGQPTPRFAAVSLYAVVEDVIRPYRAGLDARTTIEADVPAELPDVWADRTLVARAFTNLVENALQAMPEGGHLQIAGGSEPAHVTVSFTDTGVGMDLQAAARAFEPYFSTKTSGSGLGLANARRNIELCGGSIVLTSEPGRGTSVRVTLPRHGRRGDRPGAGSNPAR